MSDKPEGISEYTPGPIKLGCSSDCELGIAAGELMDKAYEYFEAARKKGVHGAVIWVEDQEGKLVVFTRGEYKQAIMENIHRLYDESAREWEPDPVLDAAPDLLSICERMNLVVGGEIHNGNIKGDCAEVIKEDLVTLRAAIAKAKGGTHEFMGHLFPR